MQYLKGNTLVDMPRIDKILEFLNETQEVQGRVVEVGVWRGGTARVLCENTYERVLLFDTFEGLPTVDPTKDGHHKGDFNDTSIQHVSSLLSTRNNWALYKGVFPQENSQYAEHEVFSLVHIDVDIYPSVKDCLEFFIPRMSKKGIIILDDYNAPTCPGAKLATDEVCELRGLTVIPTVQCQAIIRF